MLVRIFGDDVILCSLVGASGPMLVDHVPLAAALVLLLLGSATLVLACRWGPLEFRLFGIFTLILFAASLKSPMILGEGTRWQQLLHDAGGRYYFLPSLVFLWALVYCAWSVPRPLVRRLAAAAMLLFVLGAVRKWEYPAAVDLHYSSALQRLDDARKGDVVEIPITPAPWSMSLTKH